MKILLQDLRRGATFLDEVPAPAPGPGEVLIRTVRSAISPGTERMLLEFGRAGLLAKARSQPERVRQVLDKVRTDGLLPTFEAVRAKLDEPIAPGYCNAGVVVACGDADVAARLPVGTRVVSNGPHAEFVLVGHRLAAAVPDGVEDEAAAFTPLAAVALQGLRLAAPTLGETVAVFGLGLVGLFAVQLLRANGCRVLAVDLKADRLALAESFGAETFAVREGEPLAPALLAATGGTGIDAALLCTATDSQEPLREAAAACRARGRIVLTGTAGLTIDRSLFYKKELSFQVSGSYGPGRHEASYEQAGIDFPPGHVRWTLGRNFEAVLGLMKEGRLDVAPLITHRFAHGEAPGAYETLSTDSKALGIVLEYGDASLGAAPERTVHYAAAPGRDGAAVLGCGAFARRVLLPGLRALGMPIVAVGGRRGALLGRVAAAFGAGLATTDEAALLDADAAVLVVATPHHSHARLALEGMSRGRAVFCEKPAAIDLEQMRELAAVLLKDGAPRYMVGFNRRFSPHIREAAAWRARMAGPLTLCYTINAGALSGDTWLGRSEESGGRLVGEVCHFIDTVRHLQQSAIDTISCVRTTGGDPSFSLMMKFESGGIATINYTTKGSKRVPKELLTGSAAGESFELVNFRETRFHSAAKTRRFRTMRQQKGHAEELAAFVEFARGLRPAPPIPYREIVEVTLATLAAMESADTGTTQRLREWWEKLA